MTDPNTTLARIRVMVDPAQGSRHLLSDAEYIEELTKRVTELDTWLQHGGFLPGAWRHATPGTMAQVEMLDDEGQVTETCDATVNPGPKGCDDMADWDVSYHGPDRRPHAGPVYRWTTADDMTYQICASCLDADEFARLKTADPVPAAVLIDTMKAAMKNPPEPSWTEVSEIRRIALRMHDWARNWQVEWRSDPQHRIITKWDLLSDAERTSLDATPFYRAGTKEPGECSTCGEPLPTEGAFARHFIVRDPYLYNIGSCPTSKG